MRVLITLLFLPMAFAYSEVIHVNNLTGDDRSDGSESAPLRSIARALEIAGISAEIEIANTGIPYPGGNVLRRGGGTPEQPMVIEGNGAVISGLEAIPVEQWMAVEPRIYSLPFWPMSNLLKVSKSPLHWVGVPTIVWMDGEPGINCDSLETLRKTAGGYFWDKPNRIVLFHLPEGKETPKLEIPTGKTGLSVIGSVDYVEVRNLRSEYSWNDGFSTNGTGKNLVFRDCVAINNCGQGFSFHTHSGAIVEDCLIMRNASSGTCDVNEGQVTYRRCVFYKNSYEAGVYALDKTKIIYEDCLILDNEPFEQIWSLTSGTVRFVNCIISGSGKTLIKAGGGGKAEFLRCLFADADALIHFSGSAEISFDQCVFARMDAFAPEGGKFDPAWITFSETITERDIFQGGFPAGVRQENANLTGQPALRLSTNSFTGGANLPDSVWTQFEKAKAYSR